MSEQAAMPPLPEISQTQLIDIVAMAAAVKLAFPSEDYDPNVYVASATLRDERETGRLGTILIKDLPRYDPAAFMSVQYLENGFGEQRRETEVLYTLRRDLDDQLNLYVSDEIAIADTTELIWDDMPDIEVIDDAEGFDIILHAGPSQSLQEALLFESLEMSSTLKRASPQDYENLAKLLQQALHGNVHDDVSPEDEVLESSSADYVSPAEDEADTPLAAVRPRVIAKLRRLFRRGDLG